MKKQKKDDIKFSISGLFLCLFVGLIIWGVFSLVSNPEKDAINEVRKKGEVSSCRFYLRNYPNGQHMQEVRDTIFSHINRFDISAYWMLNDCSFFNEIRDSIFCTLTKLGRPICWEKILNFATPADSVVILKKYSESVDNAYYSASQINTVDGWLHYIDIVPPKDIRDAEEHIHSLLEILNPNCVGLLVITFPYSKDEYTIEVRSLQECNADLSRSKKFRYTGHNSTDSLYLPYGKYYVTISAPKTMQFSEIMTIENPREWVLLSSRRVTIKR